MAAALWRHPKHGSSFRYLALTGFSFCLVSGITVGAHNILGLSENLSGGMALAVAFMVNFFTARGVVFASKGCWRTQMVRYAVTSGIFRLGEYVAYAFLLSAFALHYLIALTVVLVVSLVLKYTTYKHWVFKGDIP